MRHTDYCGVRDVEDNELKDPSELWRVRIERVVFTAYRSGSLYCNGGVLSELSFLYRTVTEVLAVK